MRLIAKKEPNFNVVILLFVWLLGCAALVGFYGYWLLAVEWITNLAIIGLVVFIAGLFIFNIFLWHWNVFLWHLNVLARHKNVAVGGKNGDGGFFVVLAQGLWGVK